MHIIRSVTAILFGTENCNILYALMILVSLDYLTGICLAIRKKELSSSIGAKGIANKVRIFVLVSLSNVVDTYFSITGSAIEAITIMFYCTNEAISIIENAVKMGIPLPAKLVSCMKAFKSKNS